MINPQSILRIKLCVLMFLHKIFSVLAGVQSILTMTLLLSFDFSKETTLVNLQNAKNSPSGFRTHDLLRSHGDEL